MRGKRIRKWFGRNVRERLPTISRRKKGLAIFYLILVAFVLSGAGIVAGVGFFLLSMIAMDYLLVAGSSILLAASAGVFLWCYLWAIA